MEGPDRRLRSRRSFAGCARDLHRLWWGIDGNEVVMPAVNETNAGASVVARIGQMALQAGLP